MYSATLLVILRVLTLRFSILSSWCQVTTSTSFSPSDSIKLHYPESRTASPISPPGPSWQNSVFIPGGTPSQAPSPLLPPTLACAVTTPHPPESPAPFPPPSRHDSASLVVLQVKLRPHHHSHCPFLLAPWSPLSWVMRYFSIPSSWSQST